MTQYLFGATAVEGVASGLELSHFVLQVTAWLYIQFKWSLILCCHVKVTQEHFSNFWIQISVRKVFVPIYGCRIVEDRLNQ